MKGLGGMARLQAEVSGLSLEGERRCAGYHLQLPERFVLRRIVMPQVAIAKCSGRLRHASGSLVRLCDGYHPGAYGGSLAAIEHICEGSHTLALQCAA